MKFGKKLITVGFSALVLLASTNAFAGTISSRTLAGTNTETPHTVLGAGWHVLKATAVTGSGTETAKQIIPLLPDKTVATVSVSAGGATTNQAGFTAIDKNAAGANQSYYIHWAGNTASSSATVEISH
ncbi:hypothetical protein [Bacillus ndiopicus]|uniref:hypothetical protein n=1 Tax=Bacillus ndiopicus TaxID=1347368 RepID=UPI0005A917F0|nr:hypothetical protein [Bacillus ndiopicus]